jgi:alpha-L-rhamnosidase
MKQTLIFVFISVLLFMCQNKTSNTSTINLRCEHLIDPIGIDAKSPRFSWQMESQQNGASQSAYQIVIATDSHFTVESHIWDSEKIDSDGNIVNYTGPALSPFTTYYWGVQTWDNYGGNSVSKIASFETGMMEMSNWKGSWITDSRDVDLKPAPYFRKEFNSKKEIKSARAYIAVAGLYELSVNGKIVGNHRLDPMYTRFDRRTLYVTHDVTDLLNEGENAFGVLLGNGWYNHQSTAVWYFHEAPWRGRPKFCIDLRIEYMDGTVETIASDDSWTTSLSPVIFNSIYTAEHYDARLEQPGWDMVQFDDSNWRDASHAAAPSGNIVAQVLHPIRNVEEIIPVSMKKFDEFTYVFDLGRNIAGVSQLSIKGAKGTKIELAHGELVHTNGRVDLSNIDVHFRPTDDSDPFQTDIFILKGDGEESCIPRFYYKCFK